MFRVRCSAPPLTWLTSKGFLPLSSLSFSPRAFSARRRAKSLARFQVSPPENSRRWHTLNEPYGTCTRIAPKSFGPDPAEGFAPLSIHAASTWGKRTVEVCPGRPSSERGARPLWDRTAGLLRNGITLLSLPRTGRATLAASGSTGRVLDGWLDRPLSSTGNRVYRVHATIKLT